MSKKMLQAIALLMIAAMLLPVFSSCTTPNEESSNVSIDDVSEEESKIPEETGDPVTDPQYSTIVSNGASYTASTESSEKYIDSYGIELTDGIVGAEGSGDYNDGTYSGYAGNAPLIITLELGEAYTRIYEVRLGYLGTTNAGIAPPAEIEVKISKDGRSYTSAGTMTIPEFVEGTRLEAVFTSDYYLNAKYVKLIIKKLSGWIFLDEISVVSDEELKLSADEKFLEAVKSAYDKLGTVKFEGNAIPDKELALQLVSQGCTYTVSSEATKDYPDNGKYITDGKITGIYSQGKWVGYDGGSAVNITIDLGEVRSDLSEFRLTCYSNNNTGKYMPVAVTCAVSNDNSVFTDVGRVYGVYSGQSIYDFPLILDKCAEGRYVRFTLEETDSKLLLIEEAAVYAHTGKSGSGSLFAPLVFETEAKEWDKISTENRNLIRGKIQQIFIPDHVTGIGSLSNLSPADIPVLTDGKKATGNDIHNNQFFKFQSSAAPIEIYFDLGNLAAVDTFTAQFTHRTGWGVQAPYEVTVFLSDDAEVWYKAGTMDVSPVNDNSLVQASFTMKKAVQARYICFYLLTCNWVGIGELEAFGTTAVGNAPKLDKSGLATREESALGYKEPDEDLLKGAKDLCLLYHGPKLNGYTVENLIPYLGYIDADKNIVDTMFDSFLFLNSGGFYSGNTPSQGYKDGDIEWINNDLFAEGKNLLALEEAAGKVKEALKLDEDYKYGLTIALYMPTGDGMTTDEKVADIVKQMEMFEKKYNECNFKNIELVAYYWFNEGVYPTGDEPDVVTGVSEKVHARGYDFFWIPWFCASGVDSWQDHGFDVTCMQPGYVFKDTVPESRLECTANIAKYFGMGIEIEIAYDTLFNESLYRRYLEYLSGGAKFGYMENCVHMYYQEILCFYDAATSGSQKVRLIYDYTYQFIKGTLPAKPEALETVNVKGEKNSIISCKVMENASAEYTFDMVSMPESGTVSFANDGSFVFFPEKDFTGTVTFEYTYNVGLGNSELCTVEITIE